MRASRRAVLACLSICLLSATLPWAARHVTGVHGEPEHATSADTIVIPPPETALQPEPPAPRLAVEPPALSPSPPPPSQAVEPALTPPPVEAKDTPAAPQTPEPILDANQIIVYYGTPLAEGLGILGALPPEVAAQQVAERARTYDELNGETGAIGALDVIYSLAQAEPTPNGKYIRHLTPQDVEPYLQLAEEYDLQIFLDLQIGRAQILEEVRGIERYLLNPRVHVAIDPEYAVGPDGVPIETPGRITGDEINQVQTYLRELVARYNLPAKILVVHQYMEETIVDGDRVESMDGVDFVLNMDGLGEVKEKKKKYEHFSSKPYSKNDAFNIFMVHDEYVLSENEILQLSPIPKIVFYQ